MHVKEEGGPDRRGMTMHLASKSHKCPQCFITLELNRSQQLPENTATNNYMARRVPYNGQLH